MNRKRLAVICGSNGRLGGHLARGFSAAGYSVVGLDRQEASENDWPVVITNMTDESSVISSFQNLNNLFGVPSVLIQTVGMWGMSPFVETELASWRLMMDVNLTSTFLVFREAARMMNTAQIDSESSVARRLIGISSRQGANRGAAQQAAYSAAKAGVVRLVEAVAEEFADSNLTAHAVAPSTIVFDDDDANNGVHVSTIVDCCLLLASDAGEPLNGETIEAFS